MDLIPTLVPDVFGHGSSKTPPEMQLRNSADAVRSAPLGQNTTLSCRVCGRPAPPLMRKQGFVTLRTISTQAEVL